MICPVYVASLTSLYFRLWLGNASGSTSYMKEPSLLLGTLMLQPSTNRSDHMIENGLVIYII